MSSSAAAIARPLCAECSGALPAAKRTGRPRLTCSDRCRDRRRRRRVALPWPPVATRRYPIDPETLRRRSAEALVRTLEGERAAPAEDQLAQGLLEVGWLSFALERLERDLPPRLGGRAAELGSRIRRLTEDLFPELLETEEDG